jgi:hypothetical protein
MKVKIGNTIYNSENQPIMIIINDFDKRNINNMLPHCTKYCSFPAGMDKEKIEKWMSDKLCDKG